MKRATIISEKREVTTSSLIDKIHTFAILMDDRVVLEDMINKLLQDSDTMLNVIGDVPKRYQKQVLLGYKGLLQNVMNSVSHRLRMLDSKKTQG